MKIQNLLIIAALFVILFNKSIVAQEYDCFINPPEVTCGGWTSAQTTEMFAFAGGCTLTVYYNYRECTDNSCNPPRTIRQYSMGSISFNESLTECLTLARNLFPGYPDDFANIDQLYFNYMIDEIFRTIGIRDFVAFYNGLNPIQKLNYNCAGLPPNCTMPETGCKRYEVRFSNPKCRAYCIIKGTVGTSESIVTVTPLYCPGATPVACCEYKKFMCMCGTDVLVTETNTTTQGNCNPVTEPINQCPVVQPPWSRQYIDCSQSCQ